MNLKKLIHCLTKTEKIALVFLGLIIIFTAYQIGKAFYIEHTQATPVTGGIYIEGAVGTIDNLNPLYVQQGTIAHDISQLIFSGLSKYDTVSGEIVGDLANYKISSNGKEYTFVIKEGAKWHDGEEVTANDILFTYNSVIKNPEFRGVILNYNDYTGIKVTKIDDRTVQFLLEKPDSFFLVKTMVGILPKHLLENEPIVYLESAPFNFAPIGTGRYKFVSQIELADHTEYSLEAFEDHYDNQPNIKSIIFKVFSSFKELQKKTGELDGIRQVPEDSAQAITNKGKFILERYQLPQYVAIFINNESDKLKNSKTRLGLQLGTDKESLIEKIGQHKTIDTPLLEIDQENWVHQYSVTRANGALFDTEWQIPKEEKEEMEKEEGEKESEEEESEEEDGGTSKVTYINSPNSGKDWKTTSEPITITGTAPANTKSIIVNDYELQKYVPGDPGWSYVASTKFDNLKTGENIYEVYAVDYNEEKTLIDAITIHYGTTESFSEEEKEVLEEENKMATLLPTRINSKGEKMELNLITSAKPEIYSQVALIIKEQWGKIGVEVDVEVLENGDFQQRVFDRDYDLLIFGQNLGYNLDAYPYWHSSQAKKGGLNLSQFKNFVVDSLLEKARLESGDQRKKTLGDIQEIISQEVPAIFLYSPTYYTAVSKNIEHPPFENLATTSDRLSNIETWYAKMDRKFKPGTTPFTFFSWLIKQF